MYAIRSYYETLRANCPQAAHGIVLNFAPGYPASNDPLDDIAVEAADVEHNRWYLEPLITGHYPEPLAGQDVGPMPAIGDGDMALISQPRITSYNVCYTKLLRPGTR